MKKTKYEPAQLEIELLKAGDIITTSGEGAWDDDGNVDSGGWT